VEIHFNLNLKSELFIELVCWLVRGFSPGRFIAVRGAIILIVLWRQQHLCAKEHYADELLMPGYI
jgi:uncharacterized membrane protein